MNFYLKIIFFVFLLNIFNQNFITANEQAKIILKVNDEIITNLDIVNEYNYLIVMNADFAKIEKKKGIEIAKDSLIKEKIKKNELENYFDLSKESKVLDNVMKTFYTNLNLKSLESLKDYLSNFDIDYQDVKRKLQIETMWNQFIYRRFNEQVKIDTKKLKKLVLNQNKNQNSYLLSEILFKNDQKYETVKNSIIKDGFKNTALIYSISETSKIGGKIGWVNENQLSKKIINIIRNLKIGEYSKPIIISSGQLILKVENIKKIKINLDLDLELKKLESYERNRQLNQISNLYFSKIKNNTMLNEY